MNEFKVSILENGLRLDKALVYFLKDESRTSIANLIEQGHVLLNGKVAKASNKVKENDLISVNIVKKVASTLQKEDIPLDIVYEDDDILIINKPQGMVVHPSCGHFEHTLVNAILFHCEHLSKNDDDTRPGIVHRIDKDTSGLICVAKNDKAHRNLSSQLKDHTMHRTYIALVKGVIKENSGTIDMPIGRDKINRKKMAVLKEGKSAITHFEVISRYKTHTLIVCSLVTGRTHQIRVHMSAIGYPIEGDPLYSGRKFDKLYKNGQLLTAIKLTLIHPTTKKEMTFEIKPPQYFDEITSLLSN